MNLRNRGIFERRSSVILQLVTLLLLLAPLSKLYGQNHSKRKSREKILVVDNNGTMHWKGTKQVPAFFGANYTLPFAFDFRMMKKMGIDPKKEIDKDVYHMARMGLDAFRLHIWDTEVSDSLGHLLDNEHLDLLDYLLFKLKERGIKAILTPINFYNNGYPQRPTKTPGFANYISKGEAPQNRKFWPVIERYLRAFVTHVNPYTGLSYKDDPDIIAVELVNEPAHGGDPAKTTEYVDSLAAAVRSVGWNKPVFYNLSQAGTKQALAIADANIDGASFQWYPAGLVRGSALKGNYLPYVDRYPIPYRNNKRFRQLAKMVYEFSSADDPGSYIYPAMARSFRKAGFQFATQFTYTPLAIAPYNTDYQTHYLNLAYTPSKAVSMLIASKAFHQIPMYKNFGSYPADTLFGDFLVSHSRNLSEMNADTAFYYSNDTRTQPKKPAELKHIAGVGSSPVVKYDGWGVYFLDKLGNGIWRLEVMPDAIPVRDPFERASPNKTVTYIEWTPHKMTIHLPNLGGSFHINGINEGNTFEENAGNGSFTITPGTYLLVKKGKTNNRWKPDSRMGNIRIGEFVAPAATAGKPVVRHVPCKSVTAGKPVRVEATVAGLQPDEKVSLLVNAGFRSRPILMKREDTYHYVAEIPAAMVRPGVMSYRIVVGGGQDAITFPGAHPGSPMDWDYYYKDAWSTKVFDASAPVLLFRAGDDHQKIDRSFSPWRNRGVRMQTISTDDAGQMAIRVTADHSIPYSQAPGWQIYVADRLSGRISDVTSGSRLVIRAKSNHPQDTRLNVILVEKNGTSFGATVKLSRGLENLSLPLSAFRPDSMMLLPRPFPGFLPLWFKADSRQPPDLRDLQAVQFVMRSASDSAARDTCDFEIESAWLDNSGSSTDE